MSGARAGLAAFAFASACVTSMVAGVPSASAEPTTISWVIRPNQEAAVQRFLQPLALGAPVAAGYKLGGIAIELDVIVLKLESAGAAPLRFEVRHPSAARPDDRRAGPVSLRVPPGAPAALGAAIATALGARTEQQLVWVHQDAPAGPGLAGAAGLSDSTLWIGFAAVLGAAATVGGLTVFALRRRRRAAGVSPPATPPVPPAA